MDDELMIPNIVTSIFLDNIGLCDIIIYPYEDELHPHFHIKSKDSTFESCIGICEAKYYNHDNISDILSDNQAILLNNIMRSKDEDGFIVNLGCRILWGAKNGDSNLPKIVEIPNYTKLNYN